MNDTTMSLSARRTPGKHILKQLIAKDIHFIRGPLLAYMVLGLIGIGLIATGGEALFHAGAVLLLTVVIIIGAHLVFANVVHERSQQTLPLVMSLPISYRQYTLAKLLGNIGIFSLAWCILLGTTVAVILFREGLPNGLLPFSVIMLLELFLAFVLVFAVALITESEAWAIVVMTLTNVCLSLFMYGINQIDAIEQHISGPAAVWNRAALTIIGIEIVLIVALIVITLWAQSRKHDYL